MDMCAHKGWMISFKVITHNPPWAAGYELRFASFQFPAQVGSGDWGSEDGHFCISIHFKFEPHILHNMADKQVRKHNMYVYIYIYIYLYICKSEVYIDKLISLYSLLSTSRSVYKVPFLTKPEPYQSRVMLSCLVQVMRILPARGVAWDLSELAESCCAPGHVQMKTLIWPWEYYKSIVWQP